jgi:hypothetical protein
MKNNTANWKVILGRLPILFYCYLLYLTVRKKLNRSYSICFNNRRYCYLLIIHSIFTVFLLIIHCYFKPVFGLLTWILLLKLCANLLSELSGKMYFTIGKIARPDEPFGRASQSLAMTIAPFKAPLEVGAKNLIASSTGISATHIRAGIYIIVLMLENGNIHLSEAVTKVDGHELYISLAAGGLVV